MGHFVLGDFEKCKISPDFAFWCILPYPLSFQGIFRNLKYWAQGSLGILGSECGPHGQTDGKGDMGLTLARRLNCRPEEQNLDILQRGIAQEPKVYLAVNRQSSREACGVEKEFKKECFRKQIMYKQKWDKSQNSTNKKGEKPLLFPFCLYHIAPTTKKGEKISFLPPFFESLHL